MSFALLSDAAVTSSQIAANPVADGNNLYIPTLDYSDPVTGNNVVTTANIHMMKSANAGVTWAEQDLAHRPEVYQVVEATYSSPPTPPFFIIRTEVFFDAPVPNIDWPPFQNIPWALGPGAGSPPLGFQVGNNVLQISLLESSIVVSGFPVTLVVDGIFGTLYEQGSIGTQLCAALNAQLIGLGISPTDLYFATGPAAVPWNHTGLDVDLNAGDIILATAHTGAAWEISVTGNMVSNLIPASTYASVLTFYETTTPIVIWTTIGKDPGVNPIPVCFNNLSPAVIRNHVIYIAYPGLDQTVNIARYNTLTDAWMSTIVGGPPLTMIVFDSGLGGDVNLYFNACVQVRSTGDIVVAYVAGVTYGANTYNAFWAVYSGGTWGSATSMNTVGAGVKLGAPIASVIDSANNVAFMINMGGGVSGGNPFASTFIVKHDNTTVALHNIDAAPGGFAAIAYQQGNLFGGVQGMFIHPSGRILVVIGYSEPGNAHVFEITMTSLLAAGSWTKMAVTYANGVNQFVGAVDATFWNNQFQAILGQGTYVSSIYSTNIGIGTGNVTGGSADATFGASVSALSYPGTVSFQRIIYSLMAVVTPGGNLGVVYSYLDNVNFAPQYYTRFAMFSTSLFVASCNSPASGSVGGPYTHTFTSTGGVGAITWTLTSGTLPAGLALSTAGVLSGVPTAAATYTFTLTATDSAANTTTVSCSITTTAPFTANCGTGSSSTVVGGSYSQTMTKVGGVSAFTWSIISGALPAGTTLAPSTGVISGTLTTPGRYYWTAKVTDSTGNVAIVSCMATICPSGV